MADVLRLPDPPKCRVLKESDIPSRRRPMVDIGNKVEAQLAKIGAWQYLNAANFIVSCVILIVLLF